VSDPYRPPASPQSSAVEHRPGPLLWNPLTWLLLITGLMGLHSAWLTYVGEDPEVHTSGLWPFLFGILLAWWVHADRRARRIGMPYEFEAFVLFLWPLALPYYLYRTRGPWGLLYGAASWPLYQMPAATSLAVELVLAD
jgi:hypothetical protein